MRHPLLVVAGDLAITLVLGLFAVRIGIESGVETVIPANDPAIAEYEEVRRTFGSDDVAVVGVVAEDVLAPATLEKIARLTAALERLPGVSEAVSLANAIDPAADVLAPPPLLANLPPTRADVEALRLRLGEVPLYARNLVSPDFRGAAINVFFEDLSYADYVAKDLDGKIAAILDAERGPERLHFTGGAHVTRAAIETLRADLHRFTPIAALLVVVALWLSFRSVRGVVLPLASVAIAVVWTLGIMVLAGKSLHLGTFVLPPMLLVVGSSYAVHVMARYFELLDRQVEPRALVFEAFRRVWLPLGLSALTTAIGFAALTVSPIPAIFDLGLFAVVGVAALLVCSLTLLPAALACLPPERRTERSGKLSPAIERVLATLAAKSFGRQREVFAISLIVSGVAIIAGAFVRVDSNFLAYFRAAAPVRADFDAINREVVGSNVFYLVIEGEERDLLRRWEVLKLVDGLQQFVDGLPGVASTLSVVDYLELFERGLNASEGDVVLDEEGNPIEGGTAKPFWEDPKSLPPLFEILNANPDVFRAVVTPDYARGNVLVRARVAGSHEIEKILGAIREYVRGHFPPTVRVRPTGTLVLVSGTASDIVRGQAQSLALALAIIFLVFSAMFLSWRIGFLAMLPNVLPITVFFGVMGAAGVDLNLGTSLIAAIALGISVDSTIHYMARLNREVRGETDQRVVLERTLRAVGAPILYTTATLFAGFLIFAFSGFVPIQQFGLLSAMTLGVSLATNLVLLPALLSTTRVITLWDLVSVRVGEDPARTIPLFAELRPSQTRIVVLMGQLRRFEPGDAIVRRGEHGDAMYVVLAGRAEILVGEGGSRRKLNEVVRGDVFGEMGLVRGAERTADVVAVDRVEVLAVDERFLERVRARYPRIAAQVFLNLTRILSDRLQTATERWAALRA